MESVTTIIRILYDGKVKEKEITLRNFSIGRSPKDYITIKSKRISRNHIKVKILAGQVLICNNHAANGLFLDNSPVPPGRWYQLKEESILNIGGSKFDIQLRPKNNVVPLSQAAPKHTSTVLKHSQQEKPLKAPKVQGAAPSNKTNKHTPFVYKVKEKIEHDNKIFQTIEPLPQENEKKQQDLEVLEEQAQKILEQEVRALEEHLEELHSKEEKLINNIDDSQNKLNDLEQKLSKLNENLIHTHQNSSQEETYLKNNQQANEELIKEIDENRNEHQKLLAKIQESSEEYELLQIDLKHSKSQLDKTNRQIDESNQERQTLETNIEDLSKQKDNLELYTNQQNIFIERQNNESKSYERQIQATLEELKHLNEREVKTTNRINELSLDLKKLEDNKVRNVQKIDELHAQCQSFSTLVQEKKRDLYVITDKLKETEEQFDSSKQEIIKQGLESIQVERDIFLKEMEDLREEENMTITKKKDEADRILLNAQVVLEESQSEYLKNQKKCEELKTHYELEASSILEQAQYTAGQVEQSARKKAADIESGAHEREKKIIESAKNRAQEEFDHEKTQAERLIQQAEFKAKQILNEGQIELRQQKGLLSQLIAGLKKEKSSTEAQIESLKKEKEDIQAYIEDKDKLIQEEVRLIKEGHTKKMTEVLEQEHRQKKKELNEQLDQARQEIELEKSSAREYLAKMRASELEQIQQMRAQEKAEIKRNKNQNIDALSEGIEHVLQNEILKAQKNNISLNNFYLQSSDIRQLVKESMTTDEKSSTPMLDKFSPYDLIKRGKSKKVTKNLVICAVSFISFFSSFYVFPNFYTKISHIFTSAFSVDKTAEDLYIQDLRDLRKQQADLQLDKSLEYKDSYVDNILYTTDFQQVWLSDEFYKLWVVKLDEVASLELGLRENMIMEFISIEFQLMQELFKQRSKITRDLFDKHVVAMRKLEEKKRADMVETLDGEDNLKYILLAQKRLYDKFVEKNLKP